MTWIPLSMLVAGGFAVFFALLCQWWIHRAGDDRVFSSVDKIPANEVGLVLGTARKLSDGKLNRFFAYRMNAAAELYGAGKVVRLILSGSTGEGGYSEPKEMKREMIARGVPQEALLLDAGGTRTLDSVLRAKTVFGLNRFTVISQEFHNRRALFFCRHHQIDAIGFNAKSLEWTDCWRTMVREIFARIVAVGEILRLKTFASIEVTNRN
jgi:SanA protein